MKDLKYTNQGLLDFIHSSDMVPPVSLETDQFSEYDFWDFIRVLSEDKPVKPRMFWYRGIMYSDTTILVEIFEQEKRPTKYMVNQDILY